MILTPVIGFAGYSDSGKTTLIAKLVHCFQLQGIRTGVIKHDGHGHYKEVAGTDSSKYKDAGAEVTVVLSPDGYRSFVRKPLTLERMIAELQMHELDIVLVEGFKQGMHDQIALYRSVEQSGIVAVLPKPPIAVVAPSHFHGSVNGSIPVFEPDDVELIADFIGRHVREKG